MLTEAFNAFHMRNAVALALSRESRWTAFSRFLTPGVSNARSKTQRSRAYMCILREAMRGSSWFSFDFISVYCLRKMMLAFRNSNLPLL